MRERRRHARQLDDLDERADAEPEASREPRRGRGPDHRDQHDDERGVQRIARRAAEGGGQHGPSGEPGEHDQSREQDQHGSGTHQATLAAGPYGGAVTPHPTPLRTTTHGDVEAFALRVASALGLGDGEAVALAGGNQNHVVRVRAAGADVVVRFTRDAGRLGEDPFDVEAWCAPAAAAAGIRTAPVVARTHVDGVSVLVVAHVAGAPTAADDLAGWRAVGAAAARLAEVGTDDAPDGLFSRFGRDLDAAWDEHLVYNLDALGPNDALPGLGVYDVRDRSRLRDVVASVRDRRLAQGLAHGDLCHRNLVTASDGGYVILDWGSAQVGPTPWTDLELVHRWHVTGDAETPVSAAAWDEVLAATIERTAVPPDEAARIVGSLAVLHALDVVRWALDRRPDRLAELAASSAATLRRELPTLAG